MRSTTAERIRACRAVHGVCAHVNVTYAASLSESAVRWYCTCGASGVRSPLEARVDRIATEVDRIAGALKRTVIREDALVISK